MIPKTEPGLARPNLNMNGSADNPADNQSVFGRGPAALAVHPAAAPPQSSWATGFTAEEKQRLESELPKYLAPEFTSTRSGPGQSSLTYIEGWRIKNLANKLFGFDGWSHSITDVTVDFLDVDRDGKVALGVSVMVRVTLKDGTSHEDIGYGSSENQRSKASSFEKARKEAVTDALKRALTSFGNVLGTCLYDKNFCKYLKRQKFNPPSFDGADFYYYPDDRRNQQRQQQQPLAPPAPQQQQPPLQNSNLQRQPPSAQSKQIQQHNASSASSAHSIGQIRGSAGFQQMHAVNLQINPSSSTGAASNSSSGSSTVGSVQETANCGQPPRFSRVKSELDDDIFGPDFDDAKPLQPESPRMSDFDDMDMGDLLPDDSPIKPKTEALPSFNTTSDRLPTTPRRERSFSRVSSSPSLVQSSPTTYNTSRGLSKPGQPPSTHAKPLSSFAMMSNPFAMQKAATPSTVAAPAPDSSSSTPVASSSSARTSPPASGSSSRSTPPPSKTSQPHNNQSTKPSNRPSANGSVNPLRVNSMAAAAQNQKQGASSVLQNPYNSANGNPSGGLKRPLGHVGILDGLNSNKEARIV
ncbi:DNA repair and recombination protein RAD52 [Entomortierella parvispora]|uniref:DNA repair and recombination protein RAD52 n=1 Tax=Entomortierella parvispora TaxID=205924 RepID=A0A9P3LT31_9FUNG|nr:DNA repair and recombination protein RAD52 [Entomortierella parvispora]